ncbi:hypothetical protein [Chryseobacterium bernardetii]|uniref:hypothetical protein n=1 Tax=Chryseobacterium bernardetii TaxID=1241978 RepID=UPI001E4CA93C|nr:hypothetical protein [Chryseobacterium bernardetii]
MKNHLLLFMAAGVLALSGCNKAKNKTTTETVLSEKKAENFSDNLKIEFVGTDNFTIKSARLIVRLYGMDGNLADAPATLLEEKEYEQKSIPFTINFPVSKDAVSKINPKPAGPVKYYIGLSWDSDGNGKADSKGDIGIDYDKGFPNVTMNNEVQKINLKILK